MNRLIPPATVVGTSALMTTLSLGRPSACSTERRSLSLPASPGIETRDAACPNLAVGASLRGPASAPARVRDTLRFVDGEALSVINANIAQCRQGRLVFDEFRNGFLPHDVSNLIDGSNQLAVDGIIDDVLDEDAVYLEVLHRQALQVGERRQATSEVV